MKFIIRVDASETIGTGHIVRCLTLANELRKMLHDVVFIVRQMPDYFVKLIKDSGFLYISYNSNYAVGSTEDAYSTLELFRKKIHISLEDCLIIDHYMIDSTWESILKSMFIKIMVIDDLANRQHECTILLDTNLYENPEQRYKGLVPIQTRKLLGPQYALLREEFATVRSQLSHNQMSTESITNILICFGGTDPTNETMKAISALEDLLSFNMGIELTVIMGGANPNIQRIQEKCRGLKGIRLLIQPPSMALEMSKSNIAVCGGGTMTWERYCIGLPALVIAIADNQIGIAQQCEKRKIDKYLGESCFVSEDILSKEVLAYLSSPQYDKKVRQEAAMSLVDGKGVSRVARIVMDHNTLGESHV